MGRLSEIVRKAAFWVLVSFIGGAVVLGGIIEPLIFATLQDHGIIKSPEGWVWTMIVAIFNTIKTCWFDITAALLFGFAAGTWLDVLLRNYGREKSTFASSRVSIGSLRWINGIMEVGRSQSTGQFGAIMRIVVENITDELLDL